MGSIRTSWTEVNRLDIGTKTHLWYILQYNIPMTAAVDLCLIDTPVTRSALTNGDIS